MHPEYNSILPQRMCCYEDCALQMNYLEIVKCKWLFRDNLVSEMHAHYKQRVQTGIVMKKFVVAGYCQVLNGNYMCKDYQIGRDYLWDMWLR